MMKREPSSIADIATFHGVTEDQLRSLKNAMKLTWAVIDSGLIHMYGEADLGWMKKPGLSTMDLGRAAWGARF